MKLFKISQSVNNSWDTFDSIIVAAKDGFDAYTVKPFDKDSWVNHAGELSVEEIGTAKRGTKRGIILESFNAG